MSDLHLRNVQVFLVPLLEEDVRNGTASLWRIEGTDAGNQPRVFSVAVVVAEWYGQQHFGIPPMEVPMLYAAELNTVGEVVRGLPDAEIAGLLQLVRPSNVEPGFDAKRRQQTLPFNWAL